jgi:isoquinoline 1-oxidoreductase beta subunit
MLHRLHPLDAGTVLGEWNAGSALRAAKLSRRDFLKATGMAGGGLMLSFTVPAPSSAADAPADKKFVYPPNAFIKIAKDSSVTVLINKLEFGQGVFTSMAMLIAEELDCDWNKVRAEHAPAAQIYAHPGFGIQMTGGSESIKSSYNQYRVIGATARDMLLATASKRWGVALDKLDTRNGEVREQGGQKRRASYGDLVDDAMKLPVPATAKVKADRLDFKLIGKPVRRIDSREKVNGTAVFGIDFRLPNMKTAVVARPPVFGGKVQTFDGAKAKAIKGVDAVLPVPVDRGGNGVVVVANAYWPAKQGRDALEITWDPASNGPSNGPTTDAQVKQYQALAQTAGLPARADGNADAIKSAATTIDAEFEFPYLAHAPMEPLNIVVDLKADSLKLWCGSQFQTIDQVLAAQTAGLKPEQVELTTLFAGGGFGRRANPAADYVVEAVNVAKAMKTAGIDAPVKVIWSREDDIRGGYYRPLHVHRVQAGLDAKGRPVAWNHTIVGQSILKGTAFEKFLVKNGIDNVTTEGVVDTPYTLPNLRLSVHHPEVNVPVLWWRSVGHTHTAYVMETLIDEMAAAAKQDPIAYRLSLLDAKHTRHRAVLNLVRDRSGWGKAPLAKGRARGVAVHESFGSVCAHVVEVSIADKQVRVHKVTSAVDCGTAVNPLSIEAQIQSAMVYGLTAALYGKITLKNGRVEQSNFADYPVLRINEMPEMSVHIVPSQAAPTGIGEPGTPPIAPAVANAVAALTGKRLRKLPFDLSNV